MTVPTPELRSELERMLGPLAALDRRPCPYRTSFELDELDVELAGGERLELIFKNLSPTGLAEGAREAKPIFLYDPEREIEAYRDLLAPAGLGTPAFHGAAVDRERSRYWLLIERVPGVPLWQIGELERWQHVARWLAAMHERFSGEPALRDASHLLRYDAGLYRLWPERARSFASGRERERLDWLLGRYEVVVERLDALPVTFLHGELYASNVIVPERGEDGRVCPIDWELAAVGPPLIDLAALVTGSWGKRERDALALAYWDALESPGRLAPSREQFRVGLDCALLHLCMQWMGWAQGWTPPSEHRHDWLTEAISLAERIDL